MIHQEGTRCSYIFVAALLLMLSTRQLVDCASFPYDNNGGTTVAVAGRNFAVIAADTRFVRGYSVLSRGVNRIHKVQ
mgnify:CR=1 FL=1